MKRYFFIMILATSCLSASLLAQEIPRWDAAPPISVPAPTVPPHLVSGQQMAVAGMRNRSELQQALTAIKESESEADRAAAEEKLRGLLETQYDASLDNYATYLDEMQKKLAELRDQLDRRRDAKMEMVELRLKTLISTADGLGWPDERPNAYFSSDGVYSFPGTTGPPSPGPPSPFAGGSVGYGQQGPATTVRGDRGGR